jgi:hypothetical protein
MEDVDMWTTHIVAAAALGDSSTSSAPPQTSCSPQPGQPSQVGALNPIVKTVDAEQSYTTLA